MAHNLGRGTHIVPVHIADLVPESGWIRQIRREVVNQLYLLNWHFGAEDAGVSGCSTRKELYPKLTQGMAERRKTESPPDEGSWGGGQQFKSRSDPKSPSLVVWLCLVTIPVEHSSDVKQRPNKNRTVPYLRFLFSMNRSSLRSPTFVNDLKNAISTSSKMTVFYTSSKLVTMV